MEIIRAQEENIDDMMALYDHGRAYMRQNGNMDQWTNGYPDQQQILEDIRNGYSYLIKDEEEMVGVFTYICGEHAEPCYDDIDGAWLDDAPYGVIHRMASSGKVSGLVKFCSDWCLEQCPSLRIDTHPDNRPMLQALQRIGFHYCGLIVYEGEGERVAYQLLKM